MMNFRKSLLAALFVAVLFLPNLMIAGGGLEAIETTANKKTAIANGTDSVLVTVTFWRYKCAGVDGSGNHPSIVGTHELSYVQEICNSLTGNSAIDGTTTATNMITNQSLQLYYNGSLINPDNGDDYYNTGKAYFTIKSSTAGTKTLVAKSFGASASDWAGHDTVTVSFTAPVTQSTASSTSTTQATTTTQAAAPEKPKIENITLKVSDQAVTAKDLPAQTVSEEKPLFLSGKTVPNGIVHLYIHSDPFEATVTADSGGNWSYTVPTTVGTGEHTVQLAVTDPATNKTSEKSDAIKFVMVAGATTENPATNQNDATNRNLTWWYVGGGLLFFGAIGALVAYLILKKKKTKKPASQPEQSPQPALDQKSKE